MVVDGFAAWGLELFNTGTGVGLNELGSDVQYKY